MAVHCHLAIRLQPVAKMDSTELALQQQSETSNDTRIFLSLLLGGQ
jgi:hypothetical protein